MGKRKGEIMMKIGLFVLTYNRLLFTKQCLKSIEWSKPNNSIIVIVDNNSDDGTKEFLKSYSSPLLKEVVFNDKNEGIGYAWNQAWNILKDECDILAIIGNDFLFEPDWESNVLACFEDLGLDYLVGTVRPDLESKKKITSSGKGFCIAPSVGGSYFVLSDHFKNGIVPSTKAFQKGYVGPSPGFFRKLKKLKGVRIGHPGILVRDSEYTNPEYIKYYDETFSKRGRFHQLVARRHEESKGRPGGWTNWNKFCEKYYPEADKNV